MRYFLSPHYDDAVYSCGALIYTLAQAGEAVTMLTVMAGAAPSDIPPTPVLVDNHERWQAENDPVQMRRAEDQAAARILGAHTRYLDVPDCIYRMAGQRPLYATEAALWQPPHPDDPALTAINQLDLPDAEIIYAPLAVGKHVDHQLVRDWAVQQAINGVMVYFYEDFPYMRDHAAITAALSDFPLPLTASDHPFNDIALTRKVDAMRAYRSQVSTFWPDADAILPDVRATFARDCQRGGIERLWQQQR